MSSIRLNLLTKTTWKLKTPGGILVFRVLVQVCSYMAKQFLVDNPVGSFLVRLSGSDKGQYALHVKTDIGRIRQFHIKTCWDSSGKTFSIVGHFPSTFDSLDDLLLFFSKHVFNLNPSLRVKPTQLTQSNILMKPLSTGLKSDITTRHCPTCSCTINPASTSHTNEKRSPTVKEILREEIPKHNNKALDRELAFLLGLDNEYELYLKMSSTPSSKSLHIDKLVHIWRDCQGEGATKENLVEILKGKKEFTAIVQSLENTQSKPY